MEDVNVAIVNDSSLITAYQFLTLYTAIIDRVDLSTAEKIGDNAKIGDKLTHKAGDTRLYEGQGVCKSA